MKIYVVGLVIFVLVTFMFMQNISFSQNDAISIKRIDANKPSVYISFDSKVHTIELCTLKKQDSYRLRLNNNTSTPINVDALSGAFDPLSEEDMPLVKIKGANEQTYDALPKGGKVRLCYQVESMIVYESKKEGSSLYAEIPVERDVPKMDFFCTCKAQKSKERAFNSKGLWIPAGGYILFDVPQKYLAKDLKIYTLFNYEWEFTKDGLGFNEPHHQVFFYSSDIPK